MGDSNKLALGLHCCQPDGGMKMCFTARCSDLVGDLQILCQEVVSRTKNQQVQLISTFQNRKNTVSSSYSGTTHPMVAVATGRPPSPPSAPRRVASAVARPPGMWPPAGAQPHGSPGDGKLWGRCRAYLDGGGDHHWWTKT